MSKGRFVEVAAGLGRALDRFEAVMSARWPHMLAELRPGLDAQQVDHLRRVVAPYGLPAQVQALYRRFGGGFVGVFGGWSMQPLDRLVEDYRFGCGTLGKPASWLPVFADQMTNVVTLDLPGRPPSDTSVWYGHTHDVGLFRLFHSIETLLDVVCDAAEAGALIENADGLGLGDEGIESLDGAEWNTFRLARNPGCYRSGGETQAGSETGQLPGLDWPDEWLLPLDVTREELAARGVTHTIAQLLEAANDGPAYGTIRVHRILGTSGGSGWWWCAVTDGTGELSLYCDLGAVPLAMALMGSAPEVDVVVDAQNPRHADDPRIGQFPHRRIGSALAIRPISQPG